MLYMKVNILESSTLKDEASAIIFDIIYMTVVYIQKHDFFQSDLTL